MEKYTLTEELSELRKMVEEMSTDDDLGLQKDEMTIVASLLMIVRGQRRIAKAIEEIQIPGSSEL